MEYASTSIGEEEGGKTVGEYLSVLRRRKTQILAVAAVLSAIAAVVAIALPPIYRSTATILVQEQEIPPELVRSTITSYADERIQVISQQVMTRAVLLQLIDKYGLYEKYRQRRATSDELVDRIRRDIKLTTVNADISDRNSGRRANATIAFTISYDAPDASHAQKVVIDLVSRYLDENVKVREQSVAETTAFLAQEADRLAAQIQEIETNLAAFKRRNAGRLPDSSVVNMQLADRTGSEMLRIEREISMLRERKLSIETQLPTIAPHAATVSTATNDRGVPPADRLRALQAQYASASAVYGADHPDIRRMQREIAALTGQSGASEVDTEAAGKLQTLEAELASLKERYSDDHPDIQRIKRSIAALRASSSKQAATTSVQNAPRQAQRPDNPAYLSLMTQIEGTNRELNQLTAQRDELRAQQRMYDARLQQIPEVEREYHDLTRDYDNAQTRYREVKVKQMQAEVSQELEKDRKAERFSLGEPANLPEKPFSPNRILVALVGTMAALGSGVGIAGLREAFDTSVKGPLELARIATVPILVAIPYIETRWEIVGRRRRTWAMTGLVLLLTLAFLLTVNFAVKPLPLLFDSVARKITIW